MERPECCSKPMAKNGKAVSGHLRWQCSTCGKRSTLTNDAPSIKAYDEDLVTGNVNTLREKIASGANRFVITCATQNTTKNSPFFKSLLNYCEANKAELLIVPIHYKNVSAFVGKEYRKKWDKDLEQYFVDEEIDLGCNVSLMANIPISATAVNPLSGMQAIGGTRWTIYGHPQQAREPVASPSSSLPKIMYTSGSVTNKSYSESKAGAKGAFYHVMGALVVEIGENAFVRQINATSRGEFYELDKVYTPKGIKSAKPALALTLGDEHIKFNKKSVRAATYDNKDSIANFFRPKRIIRHDILDGYAGSHHHDNDDVLQFVKFHNGDNDYRAELDEVVSFLNETTPKFSETVIVSSNHHDHLYKWLSKVDPKKDPVNALLIHELKKAQYENGLKGETTDPMEIYLSDKLKCKYKFIGRNDTFMVGGVDYSQHGDVGVNGARCSAAGMAKTTYKMVIAHAHTARIEKSVFQVGTSTGQLEYAKGLSTWTNTHCLQYANGKRTLIDIFNGEWKL